MNQRELKEKYEQVKWHFRRNKKVYIATAAGVVAGAAGALILGNQQKVTASQKAIAWHVTQNLQQTTVLARRGHPGNIIRCNETGELFASQNRAGEVMGINPARITEHLQGKNPHAGGYHFEKLGEAQAA